MNGLTALYTFIHMGLISIPVQLEVLDLPASALWEFGIKELCHLWLACNWNLKLEPLGTSTVIIGNGCETDRKKCLNTLIYCDWIFHAPVIHFNIFAWLHHLPLEECVMPSYWAISCVLQVGKWNLLEGLLDVDFGSTSLSKQWT